MFENTATVNPRHDPLLGRSKTYNGRFKEQPWVRTHTVLTDRYRLVLFHYTTRSLEEYASLKFHRSHGMHATKYERQVCATNQLGRPYAYESLRR